MIRSWLLPLVALAVLMASCATIPKGRYGVAKLRLSGTEQMDPFALRACLATREREELSINLSKDPAPTCGQPPFDARRIHLGMWHWPWTSWPLYDPSVFERDLSRIERWYRARGYYGVRILDVRSNPEAALYGSPSEEDEVELEVTLDEGEPVRIANVTIEGVSSVEEALGKKILDLLSELAIDARFDESDFDLTRDKIVRTLRDQGYATADVQGHVVIDPKARTATIHFAVTPGPVMEVGDVCIEGYDKLPPKLLLQASALRPGRPFSESDLEDARTRIYQLRVVSEVEVIAGTLDPKTGVSRFEDTTRQGEWLAWSNGDEKKGEGEGESATVRVCRLAKENRGKPQVPIEIRVTPAKLYRLGLGAGIQTGVEDGQYAVTAAQQWDAHVFAYAEVRNFLGGLRRLRIEERPKVIFLAPFPRLKDSEGQTDVRPGNNLNLLLEWPAFLEARTLLRLVAWWDRGPDPYGGKFIRDDFNVGIGPSRGFFKNRLNATAMVYFNPYIPRSLYQGSDTPGARATLKAERYNLLFLQQVLEWDTRDDRNAPRRGTYARLELHEALPPSDWSYMRVAPEVRHYFALPYGLVLAARAGIGMIAIFQSQAKTAELRRLGPRPYRLRGGGPYSVRGVQAGLLGSRDPQQGYYQGGTRSWIASLELRVPLGDSFGVATFIDAGDVDGGSATEAARFRFDHPNTTIGAGVRYKTIVGPIRLDVGVLVPQLQGAGKVDYRDPLFGFRGAVQVAIGEAF